MGKRRESRIIAMKALYMYEVLKDDDIERLVDDVIEYEKFPKDDVREYALNIAKKVVLKMKTLNSIIENSTKNWTIHRMAVIDRNILRIALIEILMQDKVPDIVAIDEAIEIAKEYSTDDSGGFVNGILDHVAKNKEHFTKLISEE